MNQCVPSRDLKLSSKPTNSFVIDVPSSGYDVAPELTWKNGSLAMYGLSPRQRVFDTLESVVDQATAKSAAYKVVPWLDGGAPAASAATMDALVPCNNHSVGVNDSRPESSTQVPAMGSCAVGSCSGAAAPTGGGWSYASASQSDTFGGREVSLDSYGGGPASTSLWSPENTSSGEDNDFVCPSRSQKQQGGNRKLGVGKSSIYIAKTKAAATHNQSERRRRDKINQRMKTLQKMVPNSSKSDKASMLDEVIEYMKQLQAQVGMMSRMNMMLPLPMQQLQMSMMAAAAIGMAMPPPIMPTAAPFMPVLPWDIHPPPVSAPPEFLPNFFACQSQPTTSTMDGYRLAALYQQFKQQSSASKF